jgi:hypothetical protein
MAIVIAIVPAATVDVATIALLPANTDNRC